MDPFSMVKIIAIGGKKGSGKTVLANTLHHRLKNSVVVSFADFLKNYVSATENIPMIELYDHKHKEDHRPLLRATADHFKETFSMDFFTKTFENYIFLLIRNFNLEWIIVDDVRFPYELEFLKRAKKLYKVYVLPHQPILEDDHPSENQVSGADFDIIFDWNANNMNEAFIDILGVKNDAWLIGRYMLLVWFAVIALKFFS